MTKALSSGAIGGAKQLSGFSILPVATAASALGMITTITLLGWWRHENSFAVPVNRAASVLAGLGATLIAAAFIGGQPLNSGDLVGAVLVVVAIAALTLGARLDRARSKPAS